MTADIGTTVAAGGAAAGGTIATAILGGVIAALGGLEVGKKVGALIFPQDADLYDSYSGLSGTWQLLKDTAQAAWDGIVMLVEAAGKNLKATWEDVKTAAGIIWEAIGAAVQSGVDKITTIVDGVKTVFENIIDFIKNVFTGNWEAAWKNVTSIFETVFSGIKDVGKEPVGISPFRTMYFEDRLRDRIISLDIIAENINFAIMDTKTGNSFMVSSSNEVSESQHKIEEFCKRIFVDFLSDYLKGVPYDPTFGYGTKEDDK